jgi:hypothetical protein
MHIAAGIGYVAVNAFFLCSSYIYRNEAYWAIRRPFLTVTFTVVCCVCWTLLLVQDSLIDVQQPSCLSLHLCFYAGTYVCIDVVLLRMVSYTRYPK